MRLLEQVLMFTGKRFEREERERERERGRGGGGG